MEAERGEFAGPYAFHYEQLQQQVFDSTTTCYDCLDDAGLELWEGGLLKAHVQEGYGHTFGLRFEMLRNAYEKGKLKIGKMPDHDMFFALALAENERAAHFFGAEASGNSLNANEAIAHGLAAAISATKSFMFGLWLKTRVTQLSYSRKTCDER